MDTLEEIQEVHVTWDGYDLDALVDKNYFMEAGIHDADLVLVVTTAKYKEKADGRTGGVGLETFMASAVHWDGMLHDKKSRLVEIRREADSTPRYLSGHFHLDFKNDAEYPTRIEELLDLLRGKPAAERPKKRRSLASVADRAYEFTRVEELIRVNHPNRRAIVNGDEGTDFSGANRIKYELWETKSPALSYFLALHANANIQQTAQHAASWLLAAGLRPSDITVLRHRAGRPEQELIASAFSEKKLPSRIHECTYKEYIWDYCIDEALKTIDPPSPIENYTNQGLTYTSNETGAPVRTDSALDHIVEVLQKPSNISAHLVVAPGGMGKTSLCLSVAKQLHFRNDLRSSVILIQAESIKKYVAERGLAQARIATIYDIYELYAKYQGHGTLFERSTFDLAVVCGNLTVIIDGLDELSSLFQERFDVAAFLESLKEFHDQLGSSNILLTTRNNVVAEDADLEALAIERYELLGFDTESCKRYVTRRLQGYAAGPAMIQKVMGQIATVQIQDDEGRIIPFLADISTTVVEDELSKGKGQVFDVSDDSTPYPSNNDITDHIVYSILRREQTRHDLEIPVGEVVELISDLVIDYGKRWPLAEMQDRLKMLYETRAQSILAKLQLNPLLVSQNGDIELRYSFLSAYFEVLLMLRGLLRSSLEPGITRALCRLNPDSEEARELRRYFSAHIAEVDEALRSFIPKLRAQAISQDTAKGSTADRENAKGAISSLLHLYFGMQKLPIDTTTSKLLSIYGFPEADISTRTLEGLFIKGAFPPIDFSNLIVTKSRFHGYKNFLACRFKDSQFMYSVFEDCADLALTNTALDPSMIDGTCDPGDLREAFVLAKATKADEQAMIQTEVMNFLRSFFRGDRFIDNKRAHIKFSNKVPGLAPDKFDRLMAAGYFHLAKAKTVADFYEVAPDFKANVRRLLTDGYPDGKMKRFIAQLR
ncbi:ATP-binding protein [Polaromonas sp. P1-6]|nr:ATP-binding protein [Polaromonas sp. P1-6]